MNYKSVNKENKGLKWKTITKSSEKIGPKIISKYSVSKYHSNFDDMNIEDELDGGEETKDFEETYRFDGAELARTLR